VGRRRRKRRSGDDNSTGDCGRNWGVLYLSTYRVCRYMVPAVNKGLICPSPLHPGSLSSLHCSRPMPTHKKKKKKKKKGCPANRLTCQWLKLGKVLQGGPIVAERVCCFFSFLFLFFLFFFFLLPLTLDLSQSILDAAVGPWIGRPISMDSDSCGDISEAFLSFLFVNSFSYSHASP